MTNEEYLNNREMRRRIIEAMDALIEDGKKQVDEAESKNWDILLLTIKGYLNGLTIAKKAVLKTMDNLQPKKSGREYDNIKTRI
jgi:hypothetical protein